MVPARLVPLILAAAVAGCLPVGPRRAQGTAPQPVNDRARIRRLEAAAAELIEAGRVTPMADLIAQLDRTACSLALPAPSRRAMNPGGVYAALADSVLIVAGVCKCDRCPLWHPIIAAGFLVTEDGAFVTTHHVVDAEERHTLLAMTRDGRVFPVREVLAASKVDDVAILRLDAGDARFRPLPLAAPAGVGEAVSVISHPDKRFHVLTHGHVSRYARRIKGGRRVTQMEITADFARGSSGAPVLDARGAVAGVVLSTRSVYYEQTKDKQKNLQMVFKQCGPAAAVRRLVKP